MSNRNLFREKNNTLYMAIALFVSFLIWQSLAESRAGTMRIWCIVDERHIFRRAETGPISWRIFQGRTNVDDEHAAGLFCVSSVIFCRLYHIDLSNGGSGGAVFLFYRNKLKSRWKNWEGPRERSQKIILMCPSAYENQAEMGMLCGQFGAMQAASANNGSCGGRLRRRCCARPLPRYPFTLPF